MQRSSRCADRLLASGVAFHSLSKRPAWRWGTLACWLTKLQMLERAAASGRGYFVFLEEAPMQGIEPLTRPALASSD